MFDSGELSESGSTASDTYRSLSNYHSTQGELTVTVLGKTKTLAGLDRNEWIFLLICVPCILATIGFTLYSMIAHVHATDSPDYIFSILWLINAAFCLFYTIHGVLREREFELYCLILAILIVTVYIIVNFGLNVHPLKSIKLARFIVIVVLAPVVIGFAWIVGQGFGYLLFKTVGALTDIQDMYRTASRFSGLLKIDYQLTVILLILTIEDASNMSYFSKCCLAIGVPLQLLAALVGWIAMRTEQLLVVWCFLPLCIAQPFFIGYRIAQFSKSWNYYTNSDLEKLTYSFIAAACGAIIIRLLLLVALYFVVKNFGRGLKFKVFQVPIKGNEPSIMPSKREIRKCCGMVCCGPFG